MNRKEHTEMKNTWKAIVAGAAALILTACGSTAGSTTTTTATTAPAAASTVKTTDQDTESTTSETTAQSTSSDTGSNVLVVYYSASGNTQAVAEEIADAVGADLFEVTPKEPYTDDDLNWSNPDSRVSKEHDDESLRDVPLTTTSVDNWDSYDMVFIGYPIWWGIAAWPMDSFVKANDFTGKTVIPFCPSSSSGIGDSADLLSEDAGTGTWLDGERFSSHPNADDVTAFAQSVLAQ